MQKRCKIQGDSLRSLTRILRASGSPGDRRPVAAPLPALHAVPAASATSPHQASATGPSSAGRRPAPTTCRCPSGAAQPQQVPAPDWAPVLCTPSPPLCPLQMKRHSPRGTSRWNSREAILSPLRALRIPSGEIQILRAAKKRKHPCDWLLRGCLPLHTLGK